MQTLVYSELTFKDGKLFKGQLPQPETHLNYYKDIAVVAFPKPESSVRINELIFKSLSSRICNDLEPDAKPVPKSATIQKTDII